MKGGDPLVITGPDGADIELTVPAGLSAGDSFQVVLEEGAVRVLSKLGLEPEPEPKPKSAGSVRRRKLTVAKEGAAAGEELGEGNLAADAVVLDEPPRCDGRVDGGPSLTLSGKKPWRAREWAKLAVAFGTVWVALAWAEAQWPWLDTGLVKPFL